MLSGLMGGNLSAESTLADQLKASFSRGLSPIWMDSTSVECAEIEAAVGGAEIVCQRTGSVATERFAGPQIRKFFKTDAAACNPLRAFT